ncbi:MAG: type 1 glutamine amidotransferase [Gluconacetobacter diazotrophicus]|nr:type 1 glutamine amidotransferase [Gluconacetobacter diazotrophicus]
MTLDGKTIAILIAPRGTEEPEFTEPKAALERAGATVTVVGLEEGKAETVNGDLDASKSYPVDAVADGVSAGSFDGLVVPGGTVGADKLRASPAVVTLVRDFVAQNKPVGVICHGPWVLIEAGVAKGRTLTSFPSLRTDIDNAGGTWVDREVCEDQGVITSRDPKDLPAFCAKLVEAFAG